MTGATRPSCDRTRALLSRKLDGALSELELRAVAAHTHRCPSCRAFEAQSAWITDELRRAPLVALPQPVTVAAMRRRIPARAAANVASAAALLVVTVGGVSLTIDRSHGAGEARTLGLPSTVDSLGDAMIRDIRFEALRSGELRILPDTDTPNGVKPALPDDG